MSKNIRTIDDLQLDYGSIDTKAAPDDPRRTLSASDAELVRKQHQKQLLSHITGLAQALNLLQERGRPVPLDAVDGIRLALLDAYDEILRLNRECAKLQTAVRVLEPVGEEVAG